jgi:hypothetical protein
VLILLNLSSQVTSLQDFFRDDNIFIAYGCEKHSTGDFELSDKGKSIYQGVIEFEKFLSLNRDACELFTL